MGGSHNLSFPICFFSYSYSKQANRFLFILFTCRVWDETRYAAATHLLVVGTLGALVNIFAIIGQTSWKEKSYNISFS
jgi:hypothetical protein